MWSTACGLSTSIFIFPKMLGKMVQCEVDKLTVFTLGRGNEKTAPYLSQNQRRQIDKEAPKKAFHGGRNFK